MENKKVGYLVLGISIVMAIIIILFYQTMTDLAEGCPTVQQGLYCPAHEAIPRQTYLALSVVAILAILGLFLAFSKQREKVIIRKIAGNRKEEKRSIDLSELKPEEKHLLKIVQDNKAVFQADLIEKTGFGKAKVTRILDRLEGKGIVERKRRGMTNVVVFKE